jgi:uncharacterized protein (DUF2141 family)
MLKKAVLFLGVLFMVSAFAYAEDKYSIAGHVTFSRHENIYISLYTLEEFANFKKSLPSPPFSQKIKPNPEQRKAGRVSFTFSGVSKGAYCIVAFQDVDSNGKLACDKWGKIEEPICFYKEIFCDLSFANWNDVKFELVRDITGIIMKLD